MERKRSLMLAYIIFLAACVVIRVFIEFPAWTALVAAITTASWIFALADFKYTMANELHRSSKEASGFVNAALEDIQGTLNSIDQMLTENENINKEELTQVNQQCIEYCEQTKTKVLDILETYKREELVIKNLKYRADMRERQSKILTIAGFFAFFMVFAVEPITKWLVDSQDIMTVAAFAVILYTQYEDESFKEKRKQIPEFFNKLNNEWEELRKNFEEEVLSQSD